MALLSVDNLSVAFMQDKHTATVVDNVSFSLEKGEVLALIGESGSGKSVTAHSILQLLPYPVASHPSGSITLSGQELIGAPTRQLRAIRGNHISMVFQEPMTALNPLHTIGKQIAEVLLLHKQISRTELPIKIRELLSLVNLENLHNRLNAYPHELSGGQRQRIMIAMALACDPDILIADEPTTALDVVIQKQVIELLRKLQKERNMAMLFITHDLGLVRTIADRICVMYQGKIVEQGTVSDIFTAAQHPYTQKLLKAHPKEQRIAVNSDAPEIIRAESLGVSYDKRLGFWKKSASVSILENISLTLREGYTLGVVGESGSGKSTLALALLRLIRSKGNIVFMGSNLNQLTKAQLRPLRRKMQIVFQDPFASLNPRMTVGDIIAEGLRAHRIGTATEQNETVARVLGEVGLDPAVHHRYPHEFSGGQRQRIAIARALALQPELLIMDEPTSALDVSVQAQIIDLIHHLQEKYRLTILFISHDLQVIRALSHEVMVLKNGKIEEYGNAAEVFNAPQSAYTKLLIESSLSFAA